MDLAPSKLVEVEQSRGTTTLTSFGFIPTPPGAITGGEITDPNALSEAIKTLVDQTKTKNYTSMYGHVGRSRYYEKNFYSQKLQRIYSRNN